MLINRGIGNCNGIGEANCRLGGSKFWGIGMKDGGSFGSETSYMYAGKQILQRTKAAKNIYYTKKTGSLRIFAPDSDSLEFPELISICIMYLVVHVDFSTNTN